jgi:cell division protein FtsQ
MAAAIFFMACVLGIRLLARSFPVKKILVTGNYHLEEDEVRDAVKTSYGRDLLRLPLDDLESRLIKKAWIKKVLLRKQLPDTIMINVEEADPKALLKFREQLFIIGEDGNILEEIEDRSTPFLPVIVGVNPEEDKGGILEALKLIDGLVKTDFMSQKDSVEIMLKPYGLVLNMDGEYVKVGYGRYTEKLGRWRDLEAEIRKQNIPVDYVDLRYENEVIVKPLRKGKGKKNRK